MIVTEIVGRGAHSAVRKTSTFNNLKRSIRYHEEEMMSARARLQEMVIEENQIKRDTTAAPHEKRGRTKRGIEVNADSDTESC